MLNFSAKFKYVLLSIVLLSGTVVSSPQKNGERCNYIGNNMLVPSTSKYHISIFICNPIYNDSGAAKGVH